VTLKGGEVKRVLFTVSADTVGSHTVTIAGLEGSFGVRPVQAPEPDWVLIISLAIGGAILLGLAIFLLSRRVPEA
jgi:RsiW-degrading membrane proteinase PrsW (M82 family)